jgi:ABC-type uncharacterized transport system involved in gliding motility auxiliary subunit
MRKTIAARVLGVLGLLLLLSTVVTLVFGQTTFVVGKLALGVLGVALGFALGESGGLKRFFTGRAAHFGVLTALSALMVLVVLGVANYAALRRPKTWDLTRDKVFSLSPDTERTLAGLKAEVQVLAFYGQADEAYPRVNELLRRYAARSPRFTFKFVDPYKSPEAVKRYAISESGPRLVLLAGSEEARAKNPDEEGLTNALVRVTRSGAKKIYFTTGHGEPDPRGSGEHGYSLAVKGLEGEGYEVATLSLLEKPEIPADAAAVLVAAPRKAFLAPEVQALRTWAGKGGHLGLFLEPEVASGLDPLLEDFGIGLDDDMVVDPSPVAQLFGGSPVTPIVHPSAAHAISRELSQTGLAFPTARSLSVLTGKPVTPTPLALTSRDAWGETDIPGLFSKGAKKDAGEKSGPLPVALAAQKPAAPEADKRSGEARVVAAGDGEFFSNQYQQLLGNLDFFQNAVAWLAEQEDRMTIRPRSREASRLFLTAAQVGAIKFLTIDALPVALLGLGLAVWLVRRSR